MYNRQILKQSLANRVVDQQTINRHVNRTDENANIRSSLHPDLELNSAPSLPPMFLIPKDTLLGNLLLPYRHLIVAYTLHDSLLEDHPEEALTEAEQTEAWDAYQRETRDLSMNNSQVQPLSSPPPLRQAEPLPETESPQWKKDPICRPITLQTIQQFHCVGLDFFERMYEQLLPESYHGNLVLDMKKYLLSCVDFIQHYMQVGIEDTCLFTKRNLPFLVNCRMKAAIWSAVND